MVHLAGILSSLAGANHGDRVERVRVEVEAVLVRHDRDRHGLQLVRTGSPGGEVAPPGDNGHAGKELTLCRQRHWAYEPNGDSMATFCGSELQMVSPYSLNVSGSSNISRHMSLLVLMGA